MEVSVLKAVLYYGSVAVCFLIQLEIFFKQLEYYRQMFASGFGKKEKVWTKLDMKNQVKYWNLTNQEKLK